MKKHKLFLPLAVIMLAIGIFATGIGFVPASASTTVADPSFKLIEGKEGDVAYFNEDGTVSLDVTPTCGFGFRANASNLGEANLIDVKNFSTTVDLSGVPVNVATIIALQTVETGTIGGGNGNALNFMFRKDSDSVVAVAIYNAAASEPAYWAPGHLALGDDKCVSISINYDGEGSVVSLKLADNYVLPTSLVSREIIDEHYSAKNYKGWYSISSYYFSAPATLETTYTIKSINGKTPLENYKNILISAVEKFETATAALNDDSTDEEIKAVKNLDCFGSTTAYGTLLGVIDTDGAIAERIANAQSAYEEKYQKVLYGEVKAQIAEFATALNGLDLTDETALAAAIEKYEAIDKATMNSLPEVYKNELQESLSALTTGATFKALINNKTEKYVAEYEEKVAGGDAASLSTYKDINKIVKEWNSYKEENYITVSLSDEEIAAYDVRIAAIKAKMKSSFYATLWTEGDTWEARKTDAGLYVTGEGKYYETLGFNQKLELGKNTTIEFNLIYALRKLGANHLHIGFYPVAETGTKGSTDGVRVDFWFSDQGVIEIKPVNGKTETQIFEGPYLSIEDLGFIDVDADELDYSQGKYTITLLEENGVLVLKANGLEMELSGLAPSIFKDGCYMTVSAMSVAGAANNELLITKVGDVSYVKASEVIDPPVDSSSSSEPVEEGCHSSVISLPVTLVLAIAGVAVVADKKRRKTN